VTGAEFTSQEIGVQSNVAEPMYVSIADAAGATDTFYHPAHRLIDFVEYRNGGEIVLLEKFLQPLGVSIDAYEHGVSIHQRINTSLFGAG